MLWIEEVYGCFPSDELKSRYTSYENDDHIIQLIYLNPGIFLYYNDYETLPESIRKNNICMMLILNWIADNTLLYWLSFQDDCAGQFIFEEVFHEILAHYKGDINIDFIIKYLDDCPNDIDVVGEFYKVQKLFFIFSTLVFHFQLRIYIHLFFHCFRILYYQQYALQYYLKTC